MGTNTAVVSIISGFIVMVIGMSISGTVATTAVTANTSLATYPNAQTINNLLPMIFEIGLLVAGVALMIFGGLKLSGHA